MTVRFLLILAMVGAALALMLAAARTDEITYGVLGGALIGVVVSNLMTDRSRRRGHW